MREDGYYFVQIDFEWTVGEYIGRKRNPWLLIGNNNSLREEDIDSVGRKITQIP